MLAEGKIYIGQSLCYIMAADPRVAEIALKIKARMAAYQLPSEEYKVKVKRLSNYLDRAHKHNRSSILLAVVDPSDKMCSDAEKSLAVLLEGQGLKVVDVDVAAHEDLFLYLPAVSTPDTVFFVHNVCGGFPTLDYLNFRRELLVDYSVKVVFWVTEEELSRISREAPDFFAFRNRVVEFIDTDAQ